MSTVETSTLFRYVKELTTRLRKRPGLHDVHVSMSYLGDTRADSIQFTDGNGSQNWGVIGKRRRTENFRLGGIIWVMRAGKGDPVIEAVMERAFEILAEVETELRDDPSVGNTVRVSAVTDIQWDSEANTDGRWCQLGFDIAANEWLTRTE